MTKLCTIITPDYLHYALALWESIFKIENNSRFYIFISEHENAEYKRYIEKKFSGAFVIFCDDLIAEPRGRAIYNKYFEVDKDKFRWSMKPVLIEYLLKVKDEDAILYVDSDIRFYSDFSFLMDAALKSAVLLSPHFRSSDPNKDETNFMQLYIYGLYNGGFVGVSKSGIAAMQWWADANLFICEVDRCKGQFVDQTHLNLLPVYFNDIEIIKHRGCNLAGWNMLECTRSFSAGKVKINGVWDVVFIHFSVSTVYHINDGSDVQLLPYLAEYEASVSKYISDRDDALTLSGYKLADAEKPIAYADLFARAGKKIKDIFKKN